LYEFKPIYRPGKAYQLVRIEKFQPIPRPEGGPAFLVIKSEALVKVLPDEGQQRKITIAYRGLKPKPPPPEYGDYSAFITQCSFEALLEESGKLAEFRGAEPQKPAEVSEEEKAARDMLGHFMKEAVLEPIRYLPGKPVKLGATWQAEKKQYCVFFAGGGRIEPVEQNVKCKLSKVIDSDDGPIGVINLSIANSSIAKMARGTESPEAVPAGAVTFDLTGELRYNLESGRIVSHRVEIKSMEPDQDGALISCETQLREVENNAAGQTPDAESDPQEALVLTPSTRALSISCEVGGRGGKAIEPGDRVNILGEFDGKTHTIIAGVRVLAIGGPVESEEPAEGQATATSVISIAVSQEQALSLAELIEEAAKIRAEPSDPATPAEQQGKINPDLLKYLENEPAP
jgi:hypothetical protein